MKKIAATIAALVGFLGLAGVAVFFMETTTGAGYAVLPYNLLADLSAIVPHTAPANQLADLNAVVSGDTGAGTSTADNGVVLATSTGSPQPDSEQTPLTTAQSPVPTNNTPDIVAPTKTAPPSFNDTPVTSTDLPEATATITVTPTAPATPPPPGPTNVQTSSDGALTLPYDESNFAGDANWQSTWGALTTTATNAVQLSAAPNGIGGAVYLKNSIGWANYAMHAALNWSAGQSFGLMADYRDASNYVVCEYTKATSYSLNVQLLQYAAGNEITLTSATPVAWTGEPSNMAVSMKVGGTYATCGLGGATVSNEGAGPGKSAMANPATGGIGFMVSDPTPGTAQIIVTHVSAVGI